MPSRNLPDTCWSILSADDMAIVAPSTVQVQVGPETADRGFRKCNLGMILNKAKVMAVGCDVMPSQFYLECSSIETCFASSTLAATWQRMVASAWKSCTGSSLCFPQAQGSLEGCFVSQIEGSSGQGLSPREAGSRHDGMLFT